MKDKKTNRKSANARQEDLLQSLTVASATEVTGLIPALGENDLEETNEMYSQLYGIPADGIELPEKDDSQAQMPQS